MVIYNSLPLLTNACVYNCSDIVNDKLFVFGGCDMKGKAQNTAQYIDLSNKECFMKIKDMPRDKAGASILHIDSKIVTVGGIYDKQCQLDKVDVYDIDADVWVEMASLPNCAQGSIVVARENVVYCAGGLTTGMATLSSFGMLDMSVGHWQSLPSIPSAHFNAGGFIYEDAFYIMGGRTGKTFTSFCNCFDFRAQSWRALPMIPEDYKNIFNSCVQINDDIYLIGGLNEIPSQGFSNLVYKFDLKMEKWIKMPNILKPRADFGAFAVDDQLVIAGGMGQLQGLSATVEVFNIPTKRWSLIDDMPTVHASSTKCIKDRSMFLISGLSNTGPSKNVTEIKV